MCFQQGGGLTRITINAVAPGPVGRGMGSAPEDRIRALARVPLLRVAQADEVAAAAMFLSSAGGRIITGHVLPVDGGASATFFAAPKTAAELVHDPDKNHELTVTTPS